MICTRLPLWLMQWQELLLKKKKSRCRGYGSKTFCLHIPKTIKIWSYIVIGQKLWESTSEQVVLYTYVRCSLQELHLHNNHLSSLPDELSILKRLYVLILAFNEFTELPRVVAKLTNAKVSEVENVIMAGNQVKSCDVFFCFFFWNIAWRFWCFLEWPIGYWTAFKPLTHQRQ